MNKNQKTFNCFFIAIGLAILIVVTINRIIDSSVTRFVSNIKESTSDVSIRPLLKEQIIGISKAKYLTAKESINFQNQIELSEIKKDNKKIIVPVGSGKIVFKDNYDEKCMACIVVHEMIGEVKAINKVVIESGYFRKVEYQLVDLEKGRIDTFPSLPIFSPSCKYFVTNDGISKDSISGGINIYAPYRGYVNKVAKREGEWIPSEMFWEGDDYIFMEVNIMEDGNINSEEIRHLKISRKPFN